MAETSPTAPALPGPFVRDSAMKPRGISVTDAAKLLGVGRPALSNFLNGNAAVSPDMAARVEKAFGIPAQKLLDMQAAYDAAETKAKGSPADTKAYVPPFLGIKAREIESWADSNISARTRMSVLLRTLVNSTGRGLTKVDFPGNDDAERPGWDGSVIASEGTPWIPTGNSGWEFGCDSNPKEKADGDYATRTKAIDAATRAETTFVFVTPRVWKGKNKWESDRRNEGNWKNVRVFDASDLEQWLEQSIAAQTWFAGETNHPSGGARSLDKCWTEWAGVSNPPLAGELFSTAVRVGSSVVQSMLSRSPPEPIIVAADSTGEALAFLAQLFDERGDLAAYRDRVVVFDRPGVLARLAAGMSNFIAVAATRDVERELAPFSHSISSIVVYPRNAANAEPHVVLEPLNYEAFRIPLEAMGYSRDDIDRLSRQSGRSLTVLQRRLSNVPAIQTPAWASDPGTARRLVPFLFAGAWNSANDSDKVVLQLLADTDDYTALEQDLQALTGMDDAPVWSVGSYRGVVSKIDLLFAVSSSLTPPEINRFFEAARLVLSEDNPTVDMPEEDRWTAGMFGKTREISATMRQGVSETLVLLSVHGNALFQQRLGVNAEVQAAKLIQELLSPITTRTLEVHEPDLPTYAEVAPDTFLSILEKDLKTEAPACLGLMRPSQSGVFGRCIRAGLLWALENLAWSPATLRRSVLVLARLAEIKIEDNWANKPIESLKSVFRAWMPQTAAKIDERLSVMNLLAKRFPDIAWRICIDQFGSFSQVGHYSHKPRWRNDGHGFGEVVTPREAGEFQLAMVEMALTRDTYDRSMLSDLIERLHGLNSAHQGRVWDLIRSWAKTASNSDKGLLRDKIRMSVMMRRGPAQENKSQKDALMESARAVYTSLEPTDLLNKHAWLFRQTWIEESPEELEQMDFEGRQRKIKKLRTEALQEIVDQRGIPGILEFAEMGQAAHDIGALMADILPVREIADFILTAMPPKTESWARKNLVFGVLNSLRDNETRITILHEVHEALADEDFVKTLLLAPFSRSTWALVDALGAAGHDAYWSNTNANWPPADDEDLNAAVENLLNARRPRAAFNCAHFKLKHIRPLLLFRMLTEVVTGKDEAPGQHQLDPYYITEAFNLLDASGEFSIERMAGLEFPYIDALSREYGTRDARGIPCLELYLEDHPELYVEAVAWVYLRKDGADDPDGLRLDDAELKANRAERGYKLLEAVQRIPGRNKLGAIDADRLMGWLETVRKGCANLGRQEAGDLSLGRLLANAPDGGDSVWPCEPVRDVLERLESEDISQSITTALYNARGAHFRGEGGDQERDIAAKYRKWMAALEFSHPFVATTIMKAMVKTYEEEGKFHDTQASVRRRLS